jgi:hypothetical protein
MVRSCCPVQRPVPGPHRGASSSGRPKQVRGARTRRARPFQVRGNHIAGHPAGPERPLEKFGRSRVEGLFLSPSRTSFQGQGQSPRVQDRNSDPPLARPVREAPP